jgi:Asp-tRNA(Asn)/Glu-tRNA(Gln) amidotransferase A subunit family amidase
MTAYDRMQKSDVKYRFVIDSASGVCTLHGFHNEGSTTPTPRRAVLAAGLAEVVSPESFTLKNRLLLRNTGIALSLGLCAISVQQLQGGGLHSGLTIVMRNGLDRRLFEIAAAVERLTA